MPPEAPDAWADVIQPVGISHASLLGGPVKETPARQRRWPRLALLFLLLVVLPTVLTSAYLTLIAADRYISEAKYLLRKPNSAGRGASQTLSIEEAPKGLGSDDSFALRDYMMSRDAMRLLIDKADFRQMVARGRGDWLWQFPSLLNGDTDEDLYRYYQSVVSVDYESSTGVTTLLIQAFQPEDARRIASVLMDGGEKLLNRLNDRARADSLKVATAEVEQGRAAAMLAQDRMTAFRYRASVIDPTLLSHTVLNTIASLALQLVEAKAQLDMTRQASPNSPQIPLLRSRARALQEQIDQERNALAGSDRSLAPKIAEYERLFLQRTFAERQYISAMNLLEAARFDTERQQSFLEHVVEPAVADKARYPRRIVWPACVFLTGLVAFWLFRPSRQARPYMN